MWLQLYRHRCSHLFMLSGSWGKRKSLPPPCSLTWLQPYANQDHTVVVTTDMVSGQPHTWVTDLSNLYALGDNKGTWIYQPDYNLTDTGVPIFSCALGPEGNRETEKPATTLFTTVVAAICKTGPYCSCDDWRGLWAASDLCHWVVKFVCFGW